MKLLTLNTLYIYIYIPTFDRSFYERNPGQFGAQNNFRIIRKKIKFFTLLKQKLNGRKKAEFQISFDRALI